MTKFILPLLILMLPLVSHSEQSQVRINSMQCFHNKKNDYNEVLNCYKEANAQKPLRYEFIKREIANDVEVRTFKLVSQNWTTGRDVTPQKWDHDVEIYIPKNPLPNKAVLIINNGINHGYASTPAKPPTDYTAATLRSIAIKTSSIVISVSDVPNQYLTYEGMGTPKKEDDSVAYVIGRQSCSRNCAACD